MDLDQMLDEYWSYKEYAYCMETMRRFLLDKILELEKEGKIEQKVKNEILAAGSDWFIQNHPDLLPSI